jgi:voltage-gated potassium channel
MNERTLLTLGLLLGVGSGKPPNEWVASANEFLREKQASDPMGSVLATVLAGAAAFYAVEREHNPKVKSFFDALVYVSTNLSVGYSDIFAKTEAGKAIGTALMTYGPALAARVFDLPNEAKQRALEATASDQSLREIADKLQLILAELRAGRAERVEHG